MVSQPDNKPKKKLPSVLKYSGLAFHMAFIVGIGIFLGQVVDRRLEMAKPYFTVLFVLIFFSGFVYKLYIDLTK